MRTLKIVVWFAACGFHSTPPVLLRFCLDFGDCFKLSLLGVLGTASAWRGNKEYKNHGIV